VLLQCPICFSFSCFRKSGPQFNTDETDINCKLLQPFIGTLYLAFSLDLSNPRLSADFFSTQRQAKAYRTSERINALHSSPNHLAVSLISQQANMWACNWHGMRVTGEPPALDGTDFIIARDGRIAPFIFFRQATLSNLERADPEVDHDA
jgi:hypothetical protein